MSCSSQKLFLLILFFKLFKDCKDENDDSFIWMKLL